MPPSRERAPPAGVQTRPRVSGENILTPGRCRHRQGGAQEVCRQASGLSGQTARRESGKQGAAGVQPQGKATIMHNDPVPVSPQHTSTRQWNTVVGQLVGIEYALRTPRPVQNLSRQPRAAHTHGLTTTHKLSRKLPLTLFLRFPSTNKQQQQNNGSS